MGSRGRALVTGARRWFGVLMTLALVLIGTLVAQSAAGRAAASRLGLVAPPARYTELLLAQPAGLPRAVRSGFPVPVRFTVHNVEGAPWTYHWTATVGGARAPAARGTVRLAAGQRVTLTADVPVSCRPGPVQLRVALALPAESIAFWATCSAAAKAART